MACCSKWHHELTDGVGKCSVPMWSGGVPAGFCDEPAYGEPEPSETYRPGGYGEVRRKDGRYAGYVPGLACWNHAGPVGPPGVRVFEDGDKWCAVDEGFINVMESPCGFGRARSEAVTELLKVRARSWDGATEEAAEEPTKCHACGADVYDSESLCVECDVKARTDRQLDEEAAECGACELYKTGLEEIMEGALDPRIVGGGATALWLMDVVANHVGSGVKVPTPEEFQLRRDEKRGTHPDERVDDDG